MMSVIATLTMLMAMPMTTTNMGIMGAMATMTTGTRAMLLTMMATAMRGLVTMKTRRRRKRGG